MLPNQQGHNTSTRPIVAGTDESQVLWGAGVTADSGENRDWENKANSPVLAVAGAVPPGWTPGRRCARFCETKPIRREDRMG